METDAYAAYDRVGGPKMVHAACWAHARRKFDESIKLNKQDLVSTRILVQMGKLFAIESSSGRGEEAGRPLYGVLGPGGVAMVKRSGFSDPFA